MDINKIINEEKQKDYFIEMRTFLNERYANTLVYPPEEKLFACFTVCDMSNLKVVILGQDPYHQPHQAMGLSFSVPRGVKIPPSLANIYKELHSDVQVEIPNHGDLTGWAQQGVLLMNTVMSVEDSKANSHRNMGWEKFTDRIIQALDDYEHPLVFILWGKPAQQKARLITNKKHLLLKAVHPSPLSCYRGFFGSKPFSKANTFLQENGREPIDWSKLS